MRRSAAATGTCRLKCIMSPTRRRKGESGNQRPRAFVMRSPAEVCCHTLPAYTFGVRWSRALAARVRQSRADYEATGQSTSVFLLSRGLLADCLAPLAGATERDPRPLAEPSPGVGL